MFALSFVLFYKNIYEIYKIVKSFAEIENRRKPHTFKSRNGIGNWPHCWSQKDLSIGNRLLVGAVRGGVALPAEPPGHSAWPPAA